MRVRAHAAAGVLIRYGDGSLRGRKDQDGPRAIVRPGGRVPGGGRPDRGRGLHPAVLRDGRAHGPRHGLSRVQSVIRELVVR